MPTIEARVMVPSSPERVFALIRDVESFPQYTQTVEAVQPLGNERYRWKVRVGGIAYQWDIEVIESTPPERIAWQSLSGIQNRGRYTLVPVTGGTDVQLVIDYTLNSRWLDRTLGRAAGPVVNRISAETLQKVRSRLLAETRS